MTADQLDRLDAEFSLHCRLSAAEKAKAAILEWDALMAEKVDGVESLGKTCVKVEVFSPLGGYDARAWSVLRSGVYTYISYEDPETNASTPVTFYHGAMDSMPIFSGVKDNGAGTDRCNHFANLMNALRIEIIAGDAEICLEQVR